jgi:hypothetical protein
MLSVTHLPTSDIGGCETKGEEKETVAPAPPAAPILIPPSGRPTLPRIVIGNRHREDERICGTGHPPTVLGTRSRARWRGKSAVTLAGASRRSEHRPDCQRTSDRGFSLSIHSPLTTSNCPSLFSIHSQRITCRCLSVTRQSYRRLFKRACADGKV